MTPDLFCSWQRAGVDLVISLLEKEEAAQLDLVAEDKAAEGQGLGFISFPIPDRGIPASMPAVVTLITAITEALEKGKNVAVHCRQGIGRSGMVAAGVLINSGIEPEQAMDTVSSARGLGVPETLDQRLWLRRLSSEQPVAAH
jgi:protein-tyrosine phosphatase